ncbi:MAG: DUF4136 domain-containing protein [Rhodothalassiaceae bacterium]
MMIKSLMALAGLLVLAGCAEEDVETRVTRFNDIDPPAGQTIAIVPDNPTQVSNMQFRQYAGMIADELRRIGYRPVDRLSRADLVAQVDYDVGAAQTDLEVEWEGPYSDYWFRPGYYYPYSYGWYPGAYDYDRELEAERVYPRTLQIDIIDRDANASVFEGRVFSIGEEQDLSEIMPYMVAAMFTNFPGESGVTKVVTIEEDGLPRPANRRTAKR